MIGLRGKQSRDVNDRDDRFGVERRGPPNNRNGDGALVLIGDDTAHHRTIAVAHSESPSWNFFWNLLQVPWVMSPPG